MKSDGLAKLYKGASREANGKGDIKRVAPARLPATRKGRIEWDVVADSDT